MSTVKTTYDDRALAGEPIARDEARGLLGQVMGLVAVAVAIAASIFLDIFNIFLLLLELFGGQRD
jgi:FtsH-binding integral membrane protein